MGSRSEILAVEDVNKSFGGRGVIVDVNIGIRAGEIVGLLGPSGSGKSTLFNMIAGIVMPDSGRIFLDGRDITAATIDGRARLGIGYVPQVPMLFPELTAENNLMIAVEARTPEPAYRLARVDELCAAFGIEKFRKRRLEQLSGGQRRLVELAFSMTGNPRVLLLDEPFAALDPIVTSDLASLVRRLAGRGVGIVVTDHNVRQALRLVDRAYIIHLGQVIASGDRTSIVDDPAVRAVFLGKAFSLLGRNQPSSS